MQYKFRTYPEILFNCRRNLHFSVKIAPPNTQLMVICCLMAIGLWFCEDEGKKFGRDWVIWGIEIELLGWGSVGVERIMDFVFSNVKQKMREKSLFKTIARVPSRPIKPLSRPPNVLGSLSRPPTPPSWLGGGFSPGVSSSRQSGSQCWGKRVIGIVPLIVIQQ